MSEHCYFISAGELRAIVGDDTDHGGGRDEHSGVWFLTSNKGPAYGGVSGKRNSVVRTPQGHAAFGAAGKRRLGRTFQRGV